MRKLAVLAFLAAAARPAAAADLFHLDLASAAFLARDVVYATEIAHIVPPKDGWNDSYRYRVTRVLQGPLKVDAIIEVPTGGYALDIEPEWRLDPDGGSRRIATVARDKRVLLFLNPEPDSKRFRKVPSGMRVFGGGRVWRFEQFSNPGPYETTPAGHDPDDAFGTEPFSDPPGPAIDQAAFERDLTAALARAAAVRAAMSTPGQLARARALVKLLPPPRRFPEEEPWSSFTRSRDAISVAMLEVIAREGDDEALIASLGREVHNVYGLWRELDAAVIARHAALLLAVARDLQRPLHQRVGALTYLGIPRDLDAATQAGLAALLADSDPEVRSAAARAAVGWRRRNASEKPLRAAWAREKDAGVRFVLADVLDDLGVELTTPPLWVLRPVTHGVRPGELAVAYAYRAADTPRGDFHTTIRLAGAGLKPIVLTDPEPAATVSSSDFGSGIVRIPTPAALPAGTYTVTLDWRRGKGAKAQRGTATLALSIP